MTTVEHPPKLVILQGECYDPLTLATGLELLISTWARACADAGIATTILSESFDARVYQNPGESLTRIYAAPSAFEQTLRSLCSANTAVSCHTRAQLVPLDLGVPVALFRHNTHLSFQRWLHLCVPSPDHADKEDQERAHLAAASRWAAPSLYVKEIEPFPASVPVDMVHPFADPLLATYPRGRQMNLALYLGRPIERKGLYWLLANRSRWSFPFTWAGDLRATGPEYPVLEKVLRHFPPLTPAHTRAQVYPLLSQAPVVLCPYRQEPFGMVIIEALAAGARVVAFDEAGPAEMRGLPGLSLVKTGNVNAFDMAVVAALAAPPLSFSERQQVATTYSAESSKDAFVKHVRSTLTSV